MGVVFDWCIMLECYKYGCRLNAMLPAVARQTGHDTSDGILLHHGELLRIGTTSPKTVETLRPTCPTDPILLWCSPVPEGPSVLTVPGFCELIFRTQFEGNHSERIIDWLFTLKVKWHAMKTIIIFFAITLHCSAKQTVTTFPQPSPRRRCSQRHQRSQLLSEETFSRLQLSDGSRW